MMYSTSLSSPWTTPDRGFSGVSAAPNAHLAAFPRVRPRRPARRPAALMRLDAPPYFPCCSRACAVASAAAPGHEPMTPIHLTSTTYVVRSREGRPTSRAVPVAAGRPPLAIAIVWEHLVQNQVVFAASCFSSRIVPAASKPMARIASRASDNPPERRPARTGCLGWGVAREQPARLSGLSTCKPLTCIGVLCTPRRSGEKTSRHVLALAYA